MTFIPSHSPPQLRGLDALQLGPSSMVRGTDPVRAFLDALSPQGRETLGRRLAELMSGPGAQNLLAGLGALRTTGTPAAVDAQTGAQGPQPPRLGGAATGNVTVRGQDGSVFPVRDSHVSSPAEAAWVLGRAQQLGMGPGGNVGVQQYQGFYGLDYSQAGDNRIHTIGYGPDQGVNRINVGLVAELYRNMPKEQADAILACDLRYIQSSRIGRED